MTRNDIIRELQDAFVQRGGEVHRLAILEIVKRDHQIAMLHKEIEELRAAVLAEREECAKTCEGMARPIDDEMVSDAQWIASSCARAIRARGET